MPVSSYANTGLEGPFRTYLFPPSARVLLSLLLQCPPALILSNGRMRHSNAIFAELLFHLQWLPLPPSMLLGWAGCLSCHLLDAQRMQIHSSISDRRHNREIKCAAKGGTYSSLTLKINHSGLCAIALFNFLLHWQFSSEWIIGKSPFNLYTALHKCG